MQQQFQNSIGAALLTIGHRFSAKIRCKNSTSGFAQRQFTQAKEPIIIIRSGTSAKARPTPTCSKNFS